MTRERRCGFKIGRAEKRPPLVQAEITRAGVRGRGMRRSASLGDTRSVVVTVIVVAVAGTGRLGKLGVCGRRAGIYPVGHDVPESERPQQAAGEVTDETSTSAARRAAKGALGRR